MPIQEKARDNSLWIEITEKEGFLMFGDLSREQREERDVQVNNDEVKILCNNCKHGAKFKIREENKEKKWSWDEWRVFLQGNQTSKSSNGYNAKIRIEFYCPCCQGWLPLRPKY